MVSLADVGHEARAPVYALLAATLHIVNLIPNATNPLARTSGRLAGLFTVALVLLSAYHWAIGEAEKSDLGWLVALAVGSTLAATVAIVVVGAGISGGQLEAKERRQEDHDPEGG